MLASYAQKQSTAQKKESSSAASVLDSSSQGESLQRKADLTNSAAQFASLPPRPNNTGMPDNLKAGIESLSGFSMDNVRVHYNSSKPATVQALAYTQGTDIHVAPGQEKCLPHEAWHVAQQMAGRVSPTTNINGMPVNDNAALEHEADVMGEKAVQLVKCKCSVELNRNVSRIKRDVAQRKLIFKGSGMTDKNVGSIVSFLQGLKDKTSFGNDVGFDFSTLDKCTDKFGNVVKLNEGENFDRYVNRLLGEANVFFVGNGKDIIDACVNIAKRLKIKGGDNKDELFSVLSIAWLYGGTDTKISTVDTRALNDAISRKVVESPKTKEERQNKRIVDNIQEKYKKNMSTDLIDFVKTDLQAAETMSFVSMGEYYMKKKSSPKEKTEGTVMDEFKKTEGCYYFTRSMPFSELKNSSFKDRVGDFAQASSYNGNIMVVFSVPVDSVNGLNKTLTSKDTADCKSESRGEDFLPYGATQYSFKTDRLLGKPDVAKIHRVYWLGKKNHE